MTEWILTSSVLILLVIAVRGLFKNKMKAKYIYALWLIVLVRLLCPVNFGELSFNLLSLAEEGKAQLSERIEERETLAQQEAEVYDAWETQQEFYESHGIMYINPENPTEIVRYPVDSSELPDTYLPVEDAARAEQPVESENTANTKEAGFSFPKINWQKVIPYAWIAGMAVMVAVIFCVNVSFSWALGMFRKEQPVLAKKGHGKKELAVYLADGIYSSCLYGVVHPSIYLNEDGMGEPEKTYCIEHEYSHYLQGDMVWALCRTVCLILHWYNPLVWLAVMLSKKDAELACDERTIERLGEDERYNYGHALVELAAGQSKAVQIFGMATLMASDKKEVAERVKAIAIKKRTKLITGVAVALLAVGISVFVFTGEAKGEQEASPLPTVTATPTLTPTPMPTVDPALEEFIEKSKEEHSRNELLKDILEKNTFPVVAVTTPAKLNVRSAAGYDASCIDILLEGTEVVINALEQDADGNYWYAVSYEQKNSKETKNGYVLSNYVTKAEVVQEIIAPSKGTDWVEVAKGVVFPDTNSAPQTTGMMSNVPGEEFVYARVPGKNLYQREEGIQIRDEVVYEEVSFVDVLQVTPEKGKGWKIDLDGDGTKELFYLDELRGIYINEVLVMWMDFRDTCELCFLDIDTTDGMYEFDINSAVYYYDGSAIQTCAKFTRQTWRSGSFTSEIRQFERVDEHTISFRAYNSAHHCIMKNDFVLNDAHQLVAVNDESCFDFTHEHDLKEMYCNWKGESTVVVQDYRNIINIAYKDLSFTDHIKLTAEDENGWRIDLNGDGIKEELYIYKKQYYSYLCVNGYGVVILDGLNPEVWLLDIDTTDSVYEVLTDDGSLMVYDGKNLEQTWALRFYTFADGCAFHGTISDFTRVDEHTVSFIDICWEGSGKFEMKEVWCRLDAEHGLEKFERTDGKVQVLAEIGGSYVYPGEPFCVYEEKDENSRFVSVAMHPDNAFTTITEGGDGWFYVTTKGYGSGWIKYGSHTKLDEFLRQLDGIEVSN